jgi:hypothetical protein
MVSSVVMATSFAALLFRPSEIPDRALSQGFAVALGGWDVPAPRLTIASLPGIAGYCAAFYASGMKLARGAEDEELEHAAELFEDELSPAVAVLDAAAELGHPDATVHALVFSEDAALDDGWRFDAKGFVRHFVREGDGGIEAGIETPDGVELTEIELDLPDDAPFADEQRALEQAIRPHRGSTFLAGELGAPVLAALMGALFAADRRVEVRLVEAGPEATSAEVRRLARALGRTAGRGAFEAPAAIAGVAAPPSYQAFVKAYDWADPTDPDDRYRELAIGAIVGTLRFLRRDEILALDGDPAWAGAARAGLYPVARLTGSALGRAEARGAIVGLAGDGDRLALARPEGTITEAGPRFGELVRYLALGWSKRSETEEEMIGALMLRARLRADAGR